MTSGGHPDRCSTASARERSRSDARMRSLLPTAARWSRQEQAREALSDGARSTDKASMPCMCMVWSPTSPQAQTSAPQSSTERSPCGARETEALSETEIPSIGGARDKSASRQRESLSRAEPKAASRGRSGA